jgi:hypothetical protein
MHPSQMNPNPLAPQSILGIPEDLIPDAMEMDFSYPYTVNLTALQSLVGQVVSIQVDADFWLMSLVFTTTGTFQLRYQDGQQYYTSPDYIQSGNMPNTAGDPFPVWPAVFYPAGGRITLDIADTSNAGNTGQILFKGVSRYKLKIAS